MNGYYKILAPLFLLLLLPLAGSGQSAGRLSGNFQAEARIYRADSLIGATPVSEKLLSNSFSNFRYDMGKFSAGVRFEAYLNTLQGMDPKFDGLGVPYLFADYQSDDMGFTVGSFYEQFGSGLLLRAWEDKNLGVDNSINGVRIRSTPVKGVRLTGLIGKQRSFFDLGPGIVRAVDGEISLNDLVDKWNEAGTRLTFGGSFVSKYQQDNDPVYRLPENVAAWSPRLQLTRGGFSLKAEYARKINDPSADNNFIYKPGEALLLNATWSAKGFGLNVTAKRVDNMSFRSDRSENLNKLTINYLPAISKNHVYSLLSIYPYSSQPNGEMGLQAEASYQIKKGSWPGGRYGTRISLNLSAVNGIDRLPVNDTTPVGAAGTMGYRSPFFKVGKEIYFRDINLEISRKLSNSLKLILTGQHLVYNQLVMEGKGEIITANAAVADITWKASEKHALRAELQGLWTRQDKGNWLTALVEYSISPHWFFSLTDQWNSGNPDTSRRTHYLYGSVAWAKDASRIQLSYGKQREGILCVGGVCRNVPAMNGFTLLITTTF